ncbi:hypothetical protein V1517DRAFT_197598 [Lipomyces orientalis]|uniref:Uncharacterized protein n=1 Tax=Lipomyces orientalis TaxID=1233043 RepID=A0ACC3THU5_9ASCO
MATRRALKHIHISPTQIPYSTGAAVQDVLVKNYLDHKRVPDVVPRPVPTLLTMEFFSVYTFGRRQQHDEESVRKIEELKSKVPEADGCVTMRGGQTTFHGPGQLVAYPILDLKEFNLSTRCYVRMLEDTTIELLEGFGLRAKVTENTGVWLSHFEKIASIGVHLRRYITSHGVAINGSTDLSYFDQIVACGLPESKATSIIHAAPEEWKRQMVGVKNPIQELGNRFAAILQQNLDHRLGHGKA